MAAEPLVKRPGETRVYSVNFGFQPEIRDAAETLSGPTVSASPSGLTISGTTVSGSRVRFQVAGGANAVDYTLTVTVSTSGGSTLVEAVTLQVRSGP